MKPTQFFIAVVFAVAFIGLKAWDVHESRRYNDLAYPSYADEPAPAPLPPSSYEPREVVRSLTNKSGPFHINVKFISDGGPLNESPWVVRFMLRAGVTDDEIEALVPQRIDVENGRYDRPQARFEAHRRSNGDVTVEYGWVPATNPNVDTESIKRPATSS